MTDSPYQALGLNKVINASGKMTALGGTAQADVVAEAQRLAAGHHVDLAQLRRLAGEIVATRTGAEAASITSGAAAGIAIGVAAMITGSDQQAIEQLPDTSALANEVLLQAGHDVFFGASVVQMIRLGGGRPVLVGERSGVSRQDLESRLSKQTAGLLFVQSHHTRQSNGLGLSELVEIAGQHGLPVLVDAAAEDDLTTYVAAGADLVTYSGGKAIGGPTVGFLAGRADLIAACELQNRGIARPMKVGKEQIMGLLAALDQYPTTPTWPGRLELLEAGLASIPGCQVSRERDLAGRDIERVGLRLHPIDGTVDGAMDVAAETLRKLAAELAAGDPAVYTRNHQLEEGLLLFDLREVHDADVSLVVDRVRDCLARIGLARG